MAITFLKAAWRKLAMVNYAIDPAVLHKYLPYKTELDFYNDTCYVSLVGFLFEDTKMLGVKIPFHINFEEVNLRFYVRYKHQDTWRRGVVFIKEIVPKPALTFVARTLYGEPYETMPMNHEIVLQGDKLRVAYLWGKDDRHSMRITAGATPISIEDGTEESFITEHYWGYTKIAKEQTAQYQVKHPVWMQYPILDYNLDVNFPELYGQDFSFLNEAIPKSVLLAEGSKVEVLSGSKIR